MKNLLIILALASLACGATLPAQNNPKEYTATVNSVPDSATVRMVVSGDWYIRTAPGEHNPRIDGDYILHSGDVVICTSFYTGEDVGDGLWCHHERGWSNARGMKAEIPQERK